ncbi:hypothetical protein D3C87_2078550 [compost metagenome]
MLTDASAFASTLASDFSAFATDFSALTSAFTVAGAGLVAGAGACAKATEANRPATRVAINLFIVVLSLKFIKVRIILDPYIL